MIRGVGFMPGSYTGRTRIPVSMGYATGSPAHGLGFLGDLQSDASVAVELGIVDQQGMDTLLGMGATDEQIIALINGEIDPYTLQTQLQQQALGLSTTAPVPLPTLQPVKLDLNALFDIDWSKFSPVQGALNSLDSDISQLETWASASSDVQAQLGSEIAADRAKWKSWNDQFSQIVSHASKTDGTNLYEAGTGGAWILVASAATVLAIAGAIYAFRQQTVASDTAKAQTIMAQSGQQQYGQYIKALPHGATPQTPSQAGTIPESGSQQPKPPLTGLAWITANQSLLIGGLLLIFVAPPLLNAVGSFGRRR